jgi:hypothetical protein
MNMDRPRSPCTLELDSWRRYSAVVLEICDKRDANDGTEKNQ